MTTQEALLSAIIAHPDEDTPRLMYADWLQEYGDPNRAEFIDIQIKLARGALDDLGRPELVARKNELLSRYGDIWAADVVHQHLRTIRFGRGFVEGVDTTARCFVMNPDWGWRVPLRAARLNRVHSHGAEIATAPNFPRLQSLKIQDGKFRDDDLAELVAGATSSRLTELISGRMPHQGLAISNDGVAALARSTFCPNLTTLALNVDGNLGNPALRALANAASSLKHLQLINTDISDYGARILAAGGFKGLHSLSVIGSRIGNAGLLALVNSPQLPHLRHLGVRSSALTGAGVSAVAGATGTARLCQLELYHSVPRQSDAGAFDDIRRSHPELRVVEGWFACTFLIRQEEPELFQTKEFVDAAGMTRSGPQVAG